MALQDNYEAIKIINNANSDCTEIVKKLKQLLTSPDSITINFSDGTSTTTDSVATAINLFLGNKLSSLIITDGIHSYTLSVIDGKLNIKDQNGNLADLRVNNLIADSVSLLNVSTANIKNSELNNCRVGQANISKSFITSASINKATFNNVTINGNFELPNNTVAKSIDAGSATIRSVYINPRNPAIATPGNVVQINTSDIYGGGSMWVQGGAVPEDFGFNMNPSFCDFLYFNTSTQNYNKKLDCQLELSDGRVSSFEYAASNTMYNNTLGIGNTVLWPLKSYARFNPHTPGSVDVYIPILSSLKNYNRRVFIARNGGQSQFVFTVYTTDTTQSSDNLVTRAVNGITLKPFTAQKFMIDVCIEGTTETTCLMPM